MSKKPDILYQLEDNSKAIAYNHEQLPAFVKARKLYLHMLDEDMKPRLNADGKSLRGLKSIDKVKQIGFVD